MHIEILKMFCDLCELRSFSKTAEKNLLSQSAVSQQLAQLELIHKCQLVNRRKRPIELTKEGRLLYNTAKEMLDRYEQLKSELNSVKNSDKNRINLAAVFSIGMHSLSNYIKKFMTRYPDVNVHIEYFTANKIYELVLSGQVDIGLIAVPKRDKRLEVYDFEEEPLVFVCSPKHPLAGESEIDIHKVQFERYIGFEEIAPTHKWINDIFERYNLNIHPVMEFDNIETIKRAVEINIGVSILPTTTIIQEVTSGSIKAIKFSNENFIRPTGTIVRKGRPLSEGSQYLIELLRRGSQ